MSKVRPNGKFHLETMRRPYIVRAVILAVWRPFGVHFDSVGRMALIPLTFLRRLCGFNSRHPLHLPLPFSIKKGPITHA